MRGSSLTGRRTPFHHAVTVRDVRAVPAVTINVHGYQDKLSVWPKNEHSNRIEQKFLIFTENCLFTQ